MGSFFRMLLLAGAIASACAGVAQAHASTPWEDTPGFASLHWVGGRVVLPQSGSVLAVPTRAHGFVGADNRAYNRLTGEGGCPCEAHVRFPRRGTLKFEFDPTGYVWDGTWSKLDADALLESMRETDERYRRAYGSGYAVATAWDRPPVYDAERHVIAWMVRKHYADGSDTRFAVAVVLMRAGSEEISARTLDGGEASTWAELQAGLTALAVPAGRRYVDVRPGDRAYAPGILATIYADADAENFNYLPNPRRRLLQAVLFGALLAALGLAFAVLVAIRSGIRRRRGPFVAGSASVVTRVTSAPSSEV